MKWHTGALAAQRKTSTHSQYRGSIPQLRSTTIATLESISHCVFYKTTTNVCFFLQMRVPINTGLLEAIVEIRDKETCHNPDSGEFTDRMICTGNPCEGRGSSVVRCLLY